MPENFNNPFHFWQELKRRKVFRVVAMYAGAAYIIIELVNNVAEPLHLPEWTATVVILLVLIGFPVVAILSWIFDITPEGLKKTKSISTEDDLPKSTGRKLRISDAIIMVLIVLVIILAYPKIFNTDKFEDLRDVEGRISVAVMPFENMTGDTTLNWFQRGISSLITNGLGSSSELIVRNENTMYEVMGDMGKVITAGISQSVARDLAKKASAETYLSGSYQGAEGTYRIIANLVNSETGDIIWSDWVEGDLNSSEYLNLADSLCNNIKDFLEIQVLEKEADYDFREAYTKSSEAYKLYIEGLNSILSLDYESGIASLQDALDIDSSFTLAAFYMAYAYCYSYQDEQRNIWTQKAYDIKDKLPSTNRNWLELWYSCYIEKNLADIIRYCNLLEESGIESRLLWFDIGVTYHDFPQNYEKAEEAFRRVEEINLQRESNWEYELFYEWYGITLHKLEKHEKEQEIYDIGLSIYPNSDPINLQNTICYFSRNDTNKGLETLDRLNSNYKEKGYPEAIIERITGCIYLEANLSEKAYTYLKRAYELEHQDPASIYWLAYLLIEDDFNIEEGMTVIQKGLELYPDIPDYLRLKGWGLYKLGNLEAAIQWLQRAEEESLSFDFTLNQQIQEVKQAIANQKSE